MDPAGVRRFNEMLRILLTLCVLMPLAPCRTAESHDYWIDPQTRLMWTAKDNGYGVSLSQAARYCRDLALDGFKNWSLPSIDDLQGIFGSAENQGGYHIRGPLRLTGWQWSSTPGQHDGEGWTFDFGDGGRASVATGDSGLNRALCVRQLQ